MSSLYKLSILGIRSFSPTDHETIQFGTPLTLICGQNGCGKTTIIECLKYATTGDLPPNSKGGAFVNDPAVADRLLVNAEIKLGFISVDGKLMTVTRNMQLARKRGARGANTFKTLEGQLAVMARGHKTALSTKNADLDARVPQYLGALRAVLEYVIFCHQDDSLWPLSEAGVLKKRFDEIFEALRFTKVLDTIKTLRKDMASDIRLIEQSVHHAQVDQARARKIRDKLAASTAQAEQYTGQIADLTVQIERLEREAERLFSSNQAFQRTLGEHQRLSLVRENTRANYDRLERSLAKVDWPDEELARALAQCSGDQEKTRAALEAAEADRASAADAMLDLQARFHGLTREEGLLSYKQTQYGEKVARLAELEKTTTQGELVARQKTLDTALAAKDHEIAEASTRLRAAQSSLAREQQSRAHYIREAEECGQRARELRQKVALASADQLDAERGELETLREKRAKRSLGARSDELQAQLARDKITLARLEVENDDMVSKLAGASSLAELQTRRDVLRSSHTRKKNSWRRNVDTYGPQFQQLLGVDLDPALAPERLESRIRELEAAQKKDAAAEQSAREEWSRAAAQMQSAEENLAAARQKLSQHTNAVSAVLEGDLSEYENAVSEAEEDHRAAVFNLNTFEVTRSYQLRAVEIAEKSSCCTLCSRSMSEQEKNRFVQDLQAGLKALTAEKLRADVDATDRDVAELAAIRVDVVQARKLSGEIAALEAKAAALKSAHADLSSSLETLEASLKKTTAELSSLQSLREPVRAIASDSAEIDKLEAEIKELEGELGDWGSEVPVYELQSLQKQKAAELRAVRQAVSDATDEFHFLQKDASRLEGQIKDKQLLISNLEKALGETISLQGRITEQEELEKSLKAKIKECETLASEHELLCASLTKEVEELQRSRKEIEESAKKEIAALKAELDTLERLRADIKEYEEKDAAVVEENTRKLEEVQKEIEASKATMENTEARIKQLQAEVNDFKERERQMRDNMEYRQLEKELDRLEEQLNELDVHNAEVEKERYEVALKKLRDQISELTSSLYGKEGEVKQIRDQITNFQKELETEFKDIDKQYHKEWVKLQTNMLVSNDLQTYSQALDKAIMKYHSMKMDEINRILRELWNQTYKGTDIDGIEIKCDVSNLGKGRSYNYRVVMYKKSSELDMRGRCSAGQKVLTSILIRLALAECFGQNCGMIALDEPTTNLDVENAESLAAALNNIIDFRKNQKNFQLIVITHDEKFLSHINGDSYTDNFYRIERNENQHSVIKSLPIHLMQDD